MKYSEEEAAPHFNWYHLIDYVQSLHGEDYEKEAQHLRDHSNKWTTCACGQQDERIPRYDFGLPIDELLTSLGQDFYYAIKSKRWDHARITLDAIEKRSAQILNEIENENH